MGSYILVYILLGANPVVERIGPFKTLMGCERAASQIQTLSARSRSVCLDLNARPHTWKNGKEIPK